MMDEYRTSGKFTDEYTIQREAWDFCMGEDAPGRARSFGVGVTKSQVRGFRVELMNITNEVLSFNHPNSIDNQLRGEITRLDATIKAMQTELQIYRTAYMSGVDPMSQLYCQSHGDKKTSNMDQGNYNGSRG
ncbi:unnamed protein product [Amaranthus hypochondriacus]